jgi:hypothetical protein
VKRLLIWTLLLLLLAGFSVFAVTVPVDGSTLWQRLTGDTPGPSPADSGAAQGKNAAPKGASMQGASVPTPGTPVATDKLTEEDRRGLDRLIDSKIEKPAAPEP